MIKLTKLPEPTVLRDNRVQWTAEYKAAKAVNAPNKDDLKHRYRHQDIKSQILSETHEKCAYCESKIRHTYPGETEHIKPVARFEDEVFSWENLTLGCGECNRRKDDNYEDADGIINPYEEDPEDFLYAVGPLILPKPNSTKGKLTYELLELSRMPLVERRMDRVDKLRLMIDDYATEANATLKAVYRRKIEKQKDASTEYAMVARAFIKDTMRHARPA